MKLSRLSLAAAAILVMAALAALPTPALAQTDVGGIDGRVLDESKAAVPGATITAKNVATGLTRSATSSASGTYRIGSLPAATYEVTAELSGFAKQVRTVTVQISSNTTVDFGMSVSGQTETLMPKLSLIHI